jgi:hypothetical protein
MKSDKQAAGGPPPDTKKKRWEPPALTYIGDVADIVRAGGGKLSITGGDPGESRKPNGSG